MGLLANHSIGRGGGKFRNAFFIASSTFAILALELALIRWMSHQVRLFAYLNNLLLIGSFIGMGLGVGAGRLKPYLIHATAPLLFGLSLILAFADKLGLMWMSFPDPAMATWGGDPGGHSFTTALVTIMVLFVLVVLVFFCAASLLGYLFGRADGLTAYSLDLIGSLAGVLTITVLAAMRTPPPAWFAAGCLPLLWLSPRRVTWLSFAGLLLTTTLSIDGASFSPYNRLDLIRNENAPGQPLLMVANRDAHQNLLDLRPSVIEAPSLPVPHRAALRDTDYMYRLPFELAPGKRSALIVGAGTGNDVAAALRSGFAKVVAVEIDPVIVDIGRRRHPEDPYADPRVEVVISDARTYFERNRNLEFDVVCFGLLDSHAMFSMMSSLRLDNYVYTVESLRSAWNHVAEDGVMSVSFSVALGEWLSDRLRTLIKAATGAEPVVINFRPQFLSKTFVAAKTPEVRRAAEQSPYVLHYRKPIPPTRITTDDWPFLYLRPRTFPYGYLAVLACVVTLAAAGARRVYGASFFTLRRFSAPFMFLGAAFLLIETRAVTELSLLFGSTWIVNAAVFAGILLTALCANLAVQRIRFERTGVLFALLLLSLLVHYFIPPQVFLRFPPWVGGALAALLNGIPVGIAGIIFSTLLARSPDTAAALGWNLLGAALGGCLEYLSMATGLRALILLALALYCVAWFFTSQGAPARASELKISPTAPTAEEVQVS